MNQKNPYKSPNQDFESQGSGASISRQKTKNLWFKEAFDPTVVIRAFYMAVIVGTILVLINHGMCVYTGNFGFTCVWQSALTYLVPYTVSTVSSVLATRSK